MSTRIQTKFALRPRDRRTLERVSSRKGWSFHDTLIGSLARLIETDPDLAPLRTGREVRTASDIVTTPK